MEQMNKSINSMKFILPDNLNGRSLKSKVIPTVCNLENMLIKFKLVNGDYSQLKQWEKRSYSAYLIDEIKDIIFSSSKIEWKNIVRNHILNSKSFSLGASVIDIYLVAFVSETYGVGKEIFSKYVKDNDITDKDNSVNAIWQVGKGDGVYLDVLNYDGRVKDWEFFNKWINSKNI